MKRLGMGLWGGMRINELIDVVRLADERGYESAYLIESFSDAFCFLAACARETDQIILGTGVATVFTRNPTTIAMAAATVDSISEGRFRLGLGVGHREIHRMRDDVEIHRPSPFENPLQRLKEATELTRAILKGAFHGELVRYQGEIFHVRDYEPWMNPHRDNIEIFYGVLLRVDVRTGRRNRRRHRPNIRSTRLRTHHEGCRCARGQPGRARPIRNRHRLLPADLGQPRCGSGQARRQVQRGEPYGLPSVLPELLRSSRHG